jgi:hypothetical protein
MLCLGLLILLLLAIVIVLAVCWVLIGFIHLLVHVGDTLCPIVVVLGDRSLIGLVLLITPCVVVPDALSKIFKGPIVNVGAVLSLPTEVLREISSIISIVRDVLSKVLLLLFTVCLVLSNGCLLGSSKHF